MIDEPLRLERLAPDVLPSLLTNLWTEGHARVHVSIASSPVGRYGEGARTVRPLSVWKTLFDLAGFDVEREDFIYDSEPDDSGWSAPRHWRLVNPFRADGDRHRRAIILRRRSTFRPDPAWTAEMRRILGLRTASIDPSSISADVHLVFLVGTYQEFRQYQALWSALPRERFTVLLRDGGAEPGWINRRRCMEAWLATRRIGWRAVSDVSSVAWNLRTHKHRVLVTGADSNVFRSHILNAAFVVAARERGWRTVQLQHGIWPYADVTAPMTMASSLMLTWSGEFRKKLREIVTWPNGSRTTRGFVAGTRFVTTGCPAFDRYADAAGPRLDDLIGDWVARYRRRVLVATNLHWSQHRAGHRVNPAILALARRHPDTLFVVKTHPAHDPDEAFIRACPPNVQVLDEFACLFADLDSARLVMATDAVITTVSTVALEAGIAKRPFLVLETGNPNRYEHVTTVAPEDLNRAYDTLFDGRHDSSAFVRHYLGDSAVGDATRAVVEAIVAETGRQPSAPLDAVSLRSFADTASAQAVETFALQRRIAELEAKLSEADGVRRSREEELTRVERRVQLLQRVLHGKAAAAAAQRTMPARVGLFGASTAGVQCLETLRDDPRLRIHCFFDNDPARWGSAVAGLRVRKPTPAAFAEVDFIVVSSMHVDAIVQQVIDAGYGRKLVLDASALAARVEHALAGATR